jgi:CheY-like chemotaxis protein
MKVLIVEDDPLVRNMAAEALIDEGFEVIEAATGEEALAECEDITADVLFTDIRLPGEITGWDVAERCRQAYPSLQVIYATGYSMIEARPVPGSIFFQKPYTPDQLVRAIHSLTRGRVGP